MKPYVIRQGDYLNALAFRFGFDPQAVWNDAKNEDLRKKRKNPDVLYPGDLLFIPDTPLPPKEITAQSENPFTTAVPLTKFTVKGPPDAAYIVEGIVPPLEGTAGGDGAIELEIPVTTQELLLTYPELGFAYPLRIAHLNPVDEPSGVQGRLGNLGFGRTPMAHLLQDVLALGEPEEVLAARAITQFKQTHKLGNTAEVDEATREKLLALHESV